MIKIDTFGHLVLNVWEFRACSQVYKLFFLGTKTHETDELSARTHETIAKIGTLALTNGTVMDLRGCT